MCEVRCDIREHDHHAIDDVRHVRPTLRLFAMLAMLSRPFVVRTRRRKHDEAFSRLLLAVRELAVGAHHARSSLKPNTRDSHSSAATPFSYASIGTTLCVPLISRSPPRGARRARSAPAAGSARR